ncbi:MAG: type I restriction enzyme HsdR N-terminal domain-containing protein [Muribaculaceae bacterium]|nr:type I restriction enzyme HsdR N-terminal domain-containing protein [Muribaculaceae bacterium]
MEQPPLNLPLQELRLRIVEKTLKVFDPLRKKYVALTPEEYVRQHFTAWMTDYLGYPASLMSNEVSLSLNDTKRRCDTVVFRSDGSPAVIVEYKAPTVAITQSAFDQIARYNMVLHSSYLIVSNGLRHFCCKMDYDNNSYSFLPKIPIWSPDL